MSRTVMSEGGSELRFRGFPRFSVRRHKATPSPVTEDRVGSSSDPRIRVDDFFREREKGEKKAGRKPSSGNEKPARRCPRVESFDVEFRCVGSRDIGVTQRRHRSSSVTNDDRAIDFSYRATFEKILVGHGRLARLRNRKTLPCCVRSIRHQIFTISSRRTSGSRGRQILIDRALFRLTIPRHVFPNFFSFFLLKTIVAFSRGLLSVENFKISSRTLTKRLDGKEKEKKNRDALNM